MGSVFVYEIFIETLCKSDILFHMKKEKKKITLETIDAKFDYLGHKLDTKFNYLDKKIDSFKEYTKTGFEFMFNNLVTKTEFNDRMDDLESQIGPHNRRIDRLEDKVRVISTKIGLDK